MNIQIPMDGSNGNGNGNGNGKAFVLAQPKTPEQIARESILESMPKLRRECSKDCRLKGCVGAKWLFGQVTDLSFLHNYGGDGFGKLFTSIKDLSRIFGHDEGSIVKWRDRLVETGWIWYQHAWPKSCWGIAGITRKPELFGPGNEYVRTMAKASGTNPKISGGPPPNDKTEDFLGNTGILPADHPKPSGVPPEDFPRTTRRFPAYHPSPSGGTTRNTPPHHPKQSGTPPEGTRFATRNLPVGPPEALSSIKESLGNIGDKESKVCVAKATKTGAHTHTIPEFEPLDPKMFMRLRRDIADKIVERCKVRINAIEGSRTAVPQAQEIVAAYKARIKEARDWATGQL